MVRVYFELAIAHLIAEDLCKFKGLYYINLFESF